LYDFVTTALRVSEATFNREIVIYEMLITDADAEAVRDRYGRSPWRKKPEAYRPAKLDGFEFETHDGSTGVNSAIRGNRDMRNNGRTKSSGHAFGSGSTVAAASKPAPSSSSSSGSTAGSRPEPQASVEEDVDDVEAGTAGGQNIRRLLLRSTDGQWTCVDDPRVRSPPPRPPPLTPHTPPFSTACPRPTSPSALLAPYHRQILSRRS
jgi:hypothetical protein